MKPDAAALTEYLYHWFNFLLHASCNFHFNVEKKIPSLNPFPKAINKVLNWSKVLQLSLMEQGFSLALCFSLLSRKIETENVFLKHFILHKITKNKTSEVIWQDDETNLGETTDDNMTNIWLRVTSATKLFFATK